LLRVGEGHKRDSHGVFVDAVLVKVEGDDLLLLGGNDVLGVAFAIVYTARVLDGRDVAALSDARVRTHIEEFGEKLSVVEETPSGLESLELDLITVDGLVRLKRPDICTSW